MRCARAWSLENAWRHACEHPSPDGASQVIGAALDEYRYHLATCTVCQDWIHYQHSVMELSLTQEDCMGEKLAGILQTLVSKSQETGTGQHYQLANGLRVDVRITESKHSLLLSRANQYPSEIEWSVITRHWPPAPLFVDHEKIEQGGRFFLRASWVPEYDPEKNPQEQPA
jgi:hypothetical protein